MEIKNVSKRIFNRRKYTNHKRSGKIYGIFSGKVDENQLKKISSGLDVEIKDADLAKAYLK